MLFAVFISDRIKFLQFGQFSGIQSRGHFGGLRPMEQLLIVITKQGFPRCTAGQSCKTMIVDHIWSFTRA